MEVTRFLVERRNDALAVGDYGTYRKSLSKRLHTLRKKLGRTTPKGRKYTQKASVTAQDIASNEEFIHLQILVAERAWAHAMYMKSMHSNDSDQAITGATRTHILSRLEKARKTAVVLVASLGQSDSNASDKTLLEAQAYCSMLSGALYFEARKWTRCLEEYSITQLVYSSLAKNAGKQVEIFQELLSNTVEPSIRYAAYQQKLSRTIPIAQIVSRHVDKSYPTIQTLLKVDPSGFQEQSSTKEVDNQQRTLPKTITWRTRTVKIEDATISEALADVHEAENKLIQIVGSSELSPKEKAAAYDNVLVPSQDAVDASKTAIDELISEGVASADSRLQALQVTRTALSYDLISLRIGRYRILCGDQDGATLDPSRKKGKPETAGSKIAKLRQRVVLYDSILQSLESISELPGVASDRVLGQELDSKKAYFSALRCVSIARSHFLLGNDKPALALFAHAAKTASAITATDNDKPRDKPLGLAVTQEQTQWLRSYLQDLVTRHHALVEIHNLQQDDIKAEKGRQQGGTATPFIERMNEFPIGGVDLTRLVDYPLQLKPIPVKPILLDVAWNYIKYPGSHPSEQAASGKDNIRKSDATSSSSRSTSTADANQEKKEAKRGWWGFSRSS